MANDRRLISPAGSAWVTADTHVGVTVWLDGEHDLSTAKELAEVCERAMAVEGGGDVVVDLAGTTFLDASTVVVFEATRARLQHEARHLVLRGGSAPARQVLEICGLGALVVAGARDYSKAQ